MDCECSDHNGGEEDDADGANDAGHAPPLATCGRGPRGLRGRRGRQQRPRRDRGPERRRRGAGAPSLVHGVPVVAGLVLRRLGAESARDDHTLDCNKEGRAVEVAAPASSGEGISAGHLPSARTATATAGRRSSPRRLTAEEGVETADNGLQRDTFDYSRRSAAPAQL